MRIRAVGTGSPFCRHPLKPASFLLYSEQALVSIGCPWSLPSLLEVLETSLDAVSMFIVLNPMPYQIQGLVEVAMHFVNKKDKPILAAPYRLINALRERLEVDLGFRLESAFQVKAVNKLEIREEYSSHSIQFVQNYMDPQIPSYGLRFEEAGVFISGETPLNEDWLFKEMKSELILHACNLSEVKCNIYKAPTIAELSQLPLYLQNKIWLYGYEKLDIGDHPIPMMFVPPRAWIYDSTRRDRVLSKERFLREASRK